MAEWFTKRFREIARDRDIDPRPCYTFHRRRLPNFPRSCWVTLSGKIIAVVASNAFPVTTNFFCFSGMEFVRYPRRTIHPRRMPPESHDFLFLAYFYFSRPPHFWPPTHRFERPNSAQHPSRWLVFCQFSLYINQALVTLFFNSLISAFVSSTTCSTRMVTKSCWLAKFLRKRKVPQWQLTER